MSELYPPASDQFDAKASVSSESEKLAGLRTFQAVGQGFGRISAVAVLAAGVLVTTAEDNAANASVGGYPDSEKVCVASGANFEKSHTEDGNDPFGWCAG